MSRDRVRGERREGHIDRRQTRTRNDGSRREEPPRSTARSKPGSGASTSATPAGRRAIIDLLVSAGRP